MKTKGTVPPLQMKRLLILCYTLLACSFALPALLADAPSGAHGSGAAQSGTACAQSAVADTVGGTAPHTVRVLLGDGSVETMDMGDYLVGVVAGEMPASFELEALRAQAVAARTYTMYCAASARHGGADADVCASSGCCQAWLDEIAVDARLGAQNEMYRERLKYAVDSTAGQYLAYEGEPVLAAFHSSSAGATETCGAVWGELPYLVSVPSPETGEDVPGYVSTVELTPDELAAGVGAVCAAADFSAAPETWLGTVYRGDSGRVESVQIGGADVSGTELRRVFSLRSTAFELEYESGAFRFTVTGFGHGIGMSQYGANVMAARGADYAEILDHYYPGTTLCTQSTAAE